MFGGNHQRFQRHDVGARCAKHKYILDLSIASPLSPDRPDWFRVVCELFDPEIRKKIRL
jgi:hypothetical protein